MLGSRSDASYFGPSFMIDDLVYQYEGYDVESVLINCHYPVSQDKFVLMYGMIVKKSDRLEGEQALQTAQQFGNFIAPTRVCHVAELVVVRYSEVNQKVQPSVGSTDIEV